jgi:hypothetical protein
VPLNAARNYFEKQSRVDRATRSLMDKYVSNRDAGENHGMKQSAIYGDLSHLNAALDKKGRRS